MKTLLIMILINKDYDQYQYSLGSMVNLVPLPKIILFKPVFTQHEAPEHKLNQTSFRKTAAEKFTLHINIQI